MLDELGLRDESGSGDLLARDVCGSGDLLGLDLLDRGGPWVVEESLLGSLLEGVGALEINAARLDLVLLHVASVVALDRADVVHNNKTNKIMFE